MAPEFWARVLDGRGVGGDTAYADQWRTLVGDIWLNRGGWDGSPVDGDGNPRIYEGPVVTVLAEDGEFAAGFPTTIDGFTIQGGDQQGFPNNINQIGGGQIPGVPAEVVVQGGGIFVNGYARYLRITNNVDPEQRRRLRRGHPPRHAGRGPSRSRTTRTTISASRTTASWPTAAPTWPAPSASLPAPRTTRSPTTTSAATSRPSMAAASATMATAPAARSTTTASTLTAPTTRAAAS